MPEDLTPARRYEVVENTCWPVNLTSTDDQDGLEWKLRYAPDALTRGDQLVLASVVAAYAYLTDPNRTQEEARRSLRRARIAAQEARRGR